MSFEKLTLKTELLSALNALEYHSPTPIQQQAIPAILSGSDVLATAQTGTGKTGAFMLPILNQLKNNEEKHGIVRALVLAPTRELAQQVASSTQSYGQFTGLNSVSLYGGSNIGPQEKTLRKGVDIVVATPGRLLDHLIKGTLTLDAIEFLVFDEADRILDMGFIGEIKRIMRYLPEKKQTLLFSATLDAPVQLLVKQWLKSPKRISVDKENTAAEKITQRFYAVDEDRKRELMSHLIGKNNWQQVLIFTRTKKDADYFAKELNKDGLPTLAIHGDKTQGARDKALTQFKEGKTRILVATDVAARGLDINELNYVINAQLPFVAEDYIHRIGRTGRAGKQGEAISLVSQQEHWLLEELEVLLDERLTPQWLAGYEPNLDAAASETRQNSAKARKQRDKNKILGKRNNRRRK